MTFTPRIDVLPPSQHALWPELRAVPRRYVLYGGTALALRLAHRASVDFDFLAHDPLDHRELEQALSFVKHGETLQEGPNERTVLTGRAGASVKVSFVMSQPSSITAWPSQTSWARLAPCSGHPSTPLSPRKPWPSSRGETSMPSERKPAVA